MDIREMVKIKLERTKQIRENTNIEKLAIYVDRIVGHHITLNAQDTVLIDSIERTILRAIEDGVDRRDILHYNRFLAEYFKKEFVGKKVSYNVKLKTNFFS